MTHSSASSSADAAHEPLILPYGSHRPSVARSAFVAPNATIVGDVVVGAGARFWWAPAVVIPNILRTV